MDADNSSENDHQKIGDNFEDNPDEIKDDNDGEMETANSPMAEGEDNSPNDRDLEQMQGLIFDGGNNSNADREPMLDDDNFDLSPSQDAEMVLPSSDIVDSTPQSSSSPIETPQSPLETPGSPEESPESPTQTPISTTDTPISPTGTPGSPNYQEPDSYGSHPIKSENDGSYIQSSGSDNDDNIDSQNSENREEDISADNQISEAECLIQNPVSSEDIQDEERDVIVTSDANISNSLSVDDDIRRTDNADSFNDEVSGSLKSEVTADNMSSEAVASTTDNVDSSNLKVGVCPDKDSYKVADSTQSSCVDIAEDNNQVDSNESLDNSDYKCDTNVSLDSKVPYAEEIESPDESIDNSSSYRKLEAGAEPIESDESDSEILHMPDQSSSSSVQFARADSNQTHANISALFKNSSCTGDKGPLPDASGYTSGDDTLDLEANSPSERPQLDSHSGIRLCANIPNKGTSEEDGEVTASGQTDSREVLNYDASVNGECSVEENKISDKMTNNKPNNNNTSFNEEHVELDYDEEEERSEHEEGEMRSDDDQDMDKSDDGEIDDDEDCEEGEIREPGSKKPFVKPICRFFVKGNCTWGDNCRFLHPGINDKGNYSLIERPGFNVIMGPRGQYGPTWQQSDACPEPEILPPPPIEEPVVETAWERGLRQAKEMKKKASERKETEIDFEEKRLNLNLDDVPDKEFNKENERHRYKDPYYDAGYEEPDEYYDRPQGFQAGQYENFEVRWTRGPDMLEDFREKDRFKEKHFPPSHVERLYRPESPKLRPEPRDPRDSQPPVVRGRADEWRDPWQRSKSPIKKKAPRNSRPRRRRRSHSGSSHSSSSFSSSGSRSYSSNSYSSGSSYSRSSSFSRSSRSRSRSPGINKRPPPNSREMGRNFPPRNMDRRGGNPVYPQDSRPPVPLRNMEPRSAVSVKPQRSPDRRRPPAAPLPLTQRNVQSLAGKRERRPRTGSHSSSGSSRSTSSHSASSVSTHTSSSSNSSSGSADSQHLYRDLDNPTKHGSKAGNPQKKTGSRKNKKKPVSSTEPRSATAGKAPRQAGRPEIPNRQGPVTPVKAKDPLKLVGQKSNIKLTLLSKGDKGSSSDQSAPVKRRLGEMGTGVPPSKKQAISPTKQLTVDKVPKQPATRPEKAKSPVKEKPGPTTTKPSKPQPTAVVKLPVNKPTPPVTQMAAPAPTTQSKQKKSNSSRREELLKQLKAVEDAIARKKSKMQ
ncbi:zinc finger CCCH domain-containing protein 18 isoform X1 [Patella vulgata]|uniref:zinc finger CCCH domain-containing protein 18 isoform X1 n=1 Tax=Patella vulgata TaxID=6465 RepID=UPI0024A9BC4B|nr:zinc finger CCCH domain-containing protein 18 isoform X1 [Patella vulgata]